jgi:hypothetical protein
MKKPKYDDLKKEIEKLSILVSENMEFIRLCSIVFEKKGIATRKELNDVYIEEKKKFDELVEKSKQSGFIFDGKDFYKDNNKILYEDVIKIVGANNG